MVNSWLQYTVNIISDKCFWNLDVSKRIFRPLIKKLWMFIHLRKVKKSQLFYELIKSKSLKKQKIQDVIIKMNKTSFEHNIAWGDYKDLARIPA